MATCQATGTLPGHVRVTCDRAAGHADPSARGEGYGLSIHRDGDTAWVETDRPGQAWPVVVTGRLAERLRRA